MSGETAPAAGPLSGIRVLEIGHMLAGPYCGLLLADLGAEVIKIEPAEGDIARKVSPHTIGAHNVYFASLNRNKRSVVLDLASDSGRRALHALAQDAHALVTNLRPSAIRKLGLTYESLKSANPKLVCVALTGYGLDSPLAERPAYDYVIQALTGIMAITGDPDGPPTKAGYSAVDNSAGIMAALGLLAKVIEGRGGQVDLAMYDVMLSQMNYLAAAWLNAGETARRYSRSAHPYIVPAQIFRTRDHWLTIFIMHDESWRRFAVELCRTDWLTDSRFATMAGRRANRDAVIDAIQAVLLEDTTEHWMERLAPLGIVVSGIDTMEAALASGHVAHRGMIATVSSEGHTIRMVANPIKTAGTAAVIAAPPRLGEHTGLYLAPSEAEP